MTFSSAGKTAAPAQLASNDLPVPAQLALWMFCVACTVNGRAVTAFEKDKYDPFFFAHVAARWIRGGIPYVEIWDNKPPGIYILGRAVFTVFDRSFPALAAVEGLFVLATIALIYTTLRRAGAPVFAVVTGTAAAALAMNLQSYNSGGFMTENFIMLPALLSMTCFVRFCDSLPLDARGASVSGSSLMPGAFWMTAAGMFTGIAALFKTVGFATWLAQMALLLLLLLVGRVSMVRWIISVATATLGIIISWLPVIFYFHSHHALALMLRATFGHNVGYAASNWRSSPLFAFWHSFEALGDIGSLIACAVVVLAYTLFRCFSTATASVGSGVGLPENRWPLADRRAWLSLVVLVWLGAEMAGALAGGKGFPHYYTPALPALAILSGLALWLMLDGVESRVLLHASASALVLIPMTIPASQDLYRAWVAVRTGQNWVPEVKVTEFLNRDMHPGDTLFVCDYKPYIYFRTGMKSPSRLLFADRTRFSDYDRRYMAEIADDLKNTPPTYVVCSDPPKRTLTELEQTIQTMLAQEYRPVFPSEYTVYRRIQ